MSKEQKIKAQTMSLVWNILTVLDDVDEKGNHIKRTSFPKDFQRGFLSIKAKLLKNVEIGYVSDKPEEKEKELVWLKETEKAPEGMRKVTDRFVDGTLSFERKEKATLKFFYDKREELPDVSEEVLDELDTLMK